MNQFKFISLILFLAVILLNGCSTPPSAVSEIQKVLGGRCKEIMTGPGILNYQYTVQSPAGRGVFALAKEGSAQVCGFATVRDNIYEWERLERLAISRCEEQRRYSKISLSCRVYARNFDIVWQADPYEKIVITAREEESISMRQNRQREEQERRREQEEQLKIARDKLEKEENERIARERQEALRLENAKSQEDDEKCLSFGAVKGTQSYILCRATLAASRAEVLERQASIRVLEQKLELLNQQIRESNRERRAERQQTDETNRETLASIQASLAEERKRRERAGSQDAARTYLEMASRLLNPQQQITSPFHSYTINGRMINCSTVGALTSCR